MSENAQFGIKLCRTSQTSWISGRGGWRLMVMASDPDCSDGCGCSVYEVGGGVERLSAIFVVLLLLDSPNLAIKLIF